jgi:hypothetical protein
VNDAQDLGKLARPSGAAQTSTQESPLLFGLAGT